MAIQYKRDYDLLELDSKSDWDLTRANYRRLVNLWHPDRYAQRPRERVHAQQKFIELTKAFNNLRTFYRENQRMPFQKITQAIADSPEPEVQQRVNPKDDDILQSSILNKRKPSVRPTKDSVMKRNFWLIPAFAVVFGGLAVFVLIDRTTRNNSIEEAKRILRQTAPSAYMPKREEIVKQNKTQNMVHGEHAGKVGEQLAKDVFK